MKYIVLFQTNYNVCVSGQNYNVAMMWPYQNVPLAIAYAMKIDAKTSENIISYNKFSNEFV